LISNTFLKQDFEYDSQSFFVKSLILIFLIAENRRPQEYHVRWF